MSGKRGKEIKKIIGFDKTNPLLKRVYKRLKKHYNKIPAKQKRFFLDNLSNNAIINTYE
jgi:hypothetical protein